jgi:hypothetical protein
VRQLQARGREFGAGLPKAYCRRRGQHDVRRAAPI